MKNAYRLFVGLLVCAASAWAFADEVTEVVIENANSASEILTPMTNGNSVWVKGTTDLIRLYSGSTAGVPSTSKGLKIGGGVDRTSQIKVLTTDMQNLPLTTVLPNGILSISSTSGTTDHFEKALEINGGTVNVEKDTFNLNKGGNISISSGSITFTNKFRIGYDSGTLENPSTFTQTGGTVKINGEFLVGHYAGSVGVFNMSGGTLSVSALTLGNNGASTEKAAAKGTATFTNIANQSFSGNVTVGSSGNGTLTLDHSSITTSEYLYVGRYAGSSGEVTLKNGATFASPSHSLRIGQEGSGVVYVLSGSTLNSTGQDIHIAYSSTGDGTLTIDGGTVKANHIMVGSAGTGSLEVKNGGTITLASSKVLYVGYGAGTVGTFNMSGSDTTVTAGALYVGNKDAKTDENNKPIASVATITGGSLTSAGVIFVAAEANSAGALNVEGGTLTGNGQLRVGRYGDGSMTIKNDANVTVGDNILVGHYAGSTGVLNVEGGGKLTGGNELYVGSSGKGSLTVKNDAKVLISNDKIVNIGQNAGSTGVLNVEGGTFTANGELRVADVGNGTLNITGGSASAAKLVNVGYSEGSEGKISIKNGTLTLTNAGNTFRIGRYGTGTVEVLEGGKLIVENTNTQLGYYSGGNGTLTIDGGYAQLKALQIGYASGSTGELNVLNGTLNVYNEINVGYEGTGSATISGGVVNTVDFIVKSGMSASLTGGTLNILSYVNEGSTTLNGATINLGSNGFINSTGTFTATSGSIIVNPGDYYSESDQVLIGRFAEAETAANIKDMTTVNGWKTAAVPFGDGFSAVIAQKGDEEPTSAKVWTGAAGDNSMNTAGNWAGDASNKTGYVVSGENTFDDFSGKVVVLDGTNQFADSAIVSEGNSLIINGGTNTYGTENIEMNGTLIVNGGTFSTTTDKYFTVSGTESNPAYVEVNGGTLNASRRLTIGKTGSTSLDKLTSAKLVINNGLVQCGLSNGGFYICDSDTQNVVAELEINGGALQVQNSKPSYIGSKYSKGVLTMTGGAFSTGGEVNLATRTGSTGIIDISGGTFNTTGVLNMATGTDSTGTINISGGTFTMTNTLSVATGSNSKGKINVSGGYMKVNNIKLGRAGAGEDAQLNITGGIVEITSALYGSDSSDSGNVTISGTGQMLLNSSYTSSTYAGIRELTKFEIAGTGDGTGALRFLKSLDSSVPITLTNDATIGISAGATFTQREAINIVPKRSETQSALTVTGGGTLVLTNSELGSLDELTIDGPGTTVKIDNPGNTTNLHMSSIVLNSGALEVGEGTILDPGYGDDELPTTVAIEGDGRVILRGALFLDAYTTDKETGLDKLDFTGLDLENSEVIFGDDFNIVVNLIDVNKFLEQVVNLTWAPGLPGDLINDANIGLSISNSDGKIAYWGFNEDGSIFFADANAIPEPSTWALLILGAAGLLFVRKRKN